MTKKPIKPTLKKRSPSWESKELGDIRRNWKPRWTEKEGVRRSGRWKT